MPRKSAESPRPRKSGPPAGKRRTTAKKSAKRGRASGAEDSAPVEKEVLEQFRLIFGSAKKHFQWVQERAGVTGSQLWLLAELQRKPGISVSELAKRMAVHQSTASNLIDRLERTGLLVRERSSADQRVVNLSLTDAGNDTVRRAPKPLRGVLPDAIGSLDRMDLSQLRYLLGKLASKMKVRDRGGKRVHLAEM